MVIKKYFKIYYHLLRFFFIKRSVYRQSFFIEITIEMAYFFLTIFMFEIILGQVQGIAGWNKEQVFFLIGFHTFNSSLMLGLVQVAGLIHLPQRIITGEMDFILLKPINSLFYSCCGQPYLTSLIPAFSGLIIMANAAFKINFDNYFRKFTKKLNLQ
jgi:ABC-2 type transport system permease protein